MADHQDAVDDQAPAVEKTVLATKVKGSVKWFNVKAGYGFIHRNDTNEDVFVHQTAIVKNNPKKLLRSVGDGEQVEFDVVEGEKGNEASNVTGPDGAPVKGSEYAPDRRTRGPYRGGGGYPRRYRRSQGNDDEDGEAEEEIEEDRPRRGGYRGRGRGTGRRRGRYGYVAEYGNRYVRRRAPRDSEGAGDDDGEDHLEGEGESGYRGRGRGRGPRGGYRGRGGRRGSRGGRQNYDREDGDEEVGHLEENGEASPNNAAETARPPRRGGGRGRRGRRGGRRSGGDRSEGEADGDHAVNGEAEPKDEPKDKPKSEQNSQEEKKVDNDSTA